MRRVTWAGSSWVAGLGQDPPDGFGQVFGRELGHIAIGAGAAHMVLIGRARQRRMDDHRQAIEAGALLDAARQRKAIHLGHSRSVSTIATRSRTVLPSAFALWAM